MSEDYEHTLFKGSVKTFLDWAPAWGRDGWEVTSIWTDAPPSDYAPLFHAPARRLKREQRGWEYHFFHTYRMPPEWYNHIASCGWTLIERYIYSYDGGSYFMAKRPGHLAGFDDGDVTRRLIDLGSVPAWDSYAITDSVKDILDLKWKRSMQAGHDIGTYAAVVSWITEKLLPKLYEEKGMTSPAGNPRELFEKLRHSSHEYHSMERKVLLDIAQNGLPGIIKAAGMEPPLRDPTGFAEDLLSIRSELKDGEKAPSLARAVELLKAHLQAWSEKGVQLSLEDIVIGLKKYRGAVLGGEKAPEWAKEFWIRNKPSAKAV